MRRDERFYVYALLDPRKNNAIFYIGKGTIGKKNGVFARRRHHIFLARRGDRDHKFNTIRKLLAEGLEIGFEVLSYWGTEKEAYSEERRKIAEIGLDNLTNHTEGGDGCPGKPCSEETKRKISEAQRGEKHHFYGKHHSEKARLRMSRALRGKRKSLEHIRNQAESHRGTKHRPFKRVPSSDETCQKLRDAWKRRRKNFPITEETRRKMQESQRRRRLQEVV